MDRAASDPKGHLRDQQRIDDDDNNNNYKNVGVEPAALVLSMWEILGSILASRIGYSGFQWFSSASFNYRHSELRLFPSTNFLMRYQLIILTFDVKTA
jgi:hypothetical protein